MNMKAGNVYITVQDIIDVPESIRDSKDSEKEEDSTVLYENENTAGDDREKYEIISKAAYLLGIREWVFENEIFPPKMEVYKELDKERNARIVRNLCILRDNLEHNFSKIIRGIRCGKSIMTMPEYMPEEPMKELYDEGMDIYTNLTNPTEYLFMLNRYIAERINNCRAFFPEWVKWDYLRNIFIMEDGLTVEGIKKAAALFYSNMNNYPYKTYMNWPAQKKSGNIFKNDRKFMTLLYSWNDDEFTDINYTCDASELTKDSIYTFIDESNKCVLIVDCENSDPYSLCAAIRSLDEEKLSKIDKIILYDDVNAASAWDALSSYIDIPVEYILIERLRENKSLTDVKLATRACKEFYSNNVDSFILVSSDSDYWGLMEELPEARYLMMVEREKCSYTLKGALLENDIFYCYLDNFYAGGAEDIRQDTLHKEVAKEIKAAVDINLHDVMDEVLRKTRISMSEEEISEFIRHRIAGQIEMNVNEDGTLVAEYRCRK